MGIVKVKAGLGPRQEDLTEVEFLVDTGSLYIVISPRLAAQLGIVFGDVTTGIVTADGTRRDMPVTVGYMQLEEREAGILVGALGPNTIARSHQLAGPGIESQSS